MATASSPTKSMTCSQLSPSSEDGTRGKYCIEVAMGRHMMEEMAEADNSICGGGLTMTSAMVED